MKRASGTHETIIKDLTSTLLESQERKKMAGLKTTKNNSNSQNLPKFAKHISLKIEELNKLKQDKPKEIHTKDTSQSNFR